MKPALLPRRPWLAAALAVLALALLALAFHLTRNATLAQLDAQANAAAAARVQALESVLATQRAVAAILSDDDMVRAALASPSAATRQTVSRKLERLRVETASTVIYLLDGAGLALAASNWDEDVSFVGENYGFRDYFTAAIRDGTALEFALGIVSRRPGLYLSHIVPLERGNPGVIVVKMEFDALERRWAESGDLTRVIDASSNILLTSNPAERFATLPEEVPPVSASRPVPGAAQWQLRLTTSPAPALQAALLATAAMLGLEILVAALAIGAGRARRRAEAERRYSMDLARAVTERTRDLQAEMNERRTAEARLARMQADLVQANKLATLGQVTAGLAHEVNQPLATIRLLAENAEALLPQKPPRAGRQAFAEVADNLARIVRMSQRIAEITDHLRSFARKATGRIEAVEVSQALSASVLLTASRRRGEGARLTIHGAEAGLRVRAEAVRLEQVLVNLIQNAQEALHATTEPEIHIRVEADDEHVTFIVSDNGPGLSPAIAAQLFTPFSTSKPDGLGLGLVIARDIARDLGGELSLDPPVTGAGASFRLRLERA